LDERQLMTELKTLRVAQVGGRRAPHKPLLLLWLLHIFVKRRRWGATYDEAEAPVGHLIGKYAPGAADATDLAAHPFVRLERSIWQPEVVPLDRTP
jgi:putative restriction endonuclease